MDWTSFITWKILQCHSLKFTRRHALWTWLALDLQWKTIVDGWYALPHSIRSWVRLPDHLPHRAVCEVLQGVVVIWTSKCWGLPLTKDFLEGLFWRAFQLAMANVKGFPPSGEVPTSVPVVDWVKLLSGQYVAGLTDQSGMLQFVELYRTRK